MTGGQGMRRMAMSVLWPAFLVAALADGFFFSLVDPREVLPADLGLTALGAYTVGFFFFWLVCALAGTLTYYLAQVPEDHDAPF